MGTAWVQDHLTPGPTTDREEGSVIEKSLSPAPPRAPGDDQGQHSAHELLGALAAVLEALDIPHAATVGDDETRTRILLERVGHTVVMLNSILLAEHPAPDAAWAIAYLRARLAE